MTQSQEMIVLYWQVTAAFLMGFDYFVKDVWREKANIFVRSYFAGVQDRIDHDLKLSWGRFTSKVPQIMGGVIFLGAYWFLMEVVIPVFESPVAVVSLTLFAFVLFSGGFLSIFQIFMELFIPVGLGLSLRAVTTFLVSSPKGAIAAMGMLCLFISFILRYVYISAT
jgi:hypothetical protein